MGLSWEQGGRVPEPSCQLTDHRHYQGVRALGFFLPPPPQPEHGLREQSSWDVCPGTVGLQALGTRLMPTGLD